MHASSPSTLPTHARELLASLVGRRLTSARRQGGTRGGSSHREVGGELELGLDDGRAIAVTLDEKSRSVLVAEGALGPDVHDASRHEYWRWRLGREIAGVAVWKSRDVRPDAPELEFGLELRLRNGPPVVLELVEVETEMTLVASDGEGSEPHRWLEMAGEFPPPPSARRKFERAVALRRTQRPGRRRPRR